MRNTNTLTLALNLGTGTWFVSVLCTLRSIMDWLSSDTAPLDPLFWSAAVLGRGWILFMRSLRELKLSDCGTLRIKGFCEEEDKSQSLYQGQNSAVLRAATYSRRWYVFHLGPSFIYAMALFQDRLCSWTLSSCRGEWALIVLWCFIVKSWRPHFKAVLPLCRELPANRLFNQDFLSTWEKKMATFYI